MTDAPLDSAIAWAVLLALFIWNGVITWRNRDR
jgi:hypothetical protein